MMMHFNFHPALSTYLYMAYPFGILAERNVPNALLNWNIQLAFQKLKSGKDVHKLTLYPVLNFAQYESLGLFQSEIRVLGRMPKSKVKGLTKDMLGLLARGYYLMVYADHFYLPGTAHYARTHFRHEVLIYGCMPATESFKGVLYLPSGSLGGIDIPYEMLVQAFVSPHARGEECSPYCRGDLLAGYRPVTDSVRKIKLDLTAIRSQIEWFLDPKVMFRDLAGADLQTQDRQNGALQRQGVSFGRDVYAGMTAYYGRFLASERLRYDLRVSRMLWEQKRLMSLRLCRLVRSPARLRPNAIAGWDEVESLAKCIHLRAVSARRHSKIALLRRILDELDELNLREATLLTRVVDAF